MQPLAIYVLASGAVMILGVSTTLAMVRHGLRRRRNAISRWHMHGSIPLAGAALAIGAISFSDGQSSATHKVIYVTGATLLLAALLCATIGATAASRR
jgi:drug/metabolite transporter (DMT)-like permease